MEQTRQATCPNCRQTGDFRFSGEQQWPRDVAAVLGLPAVIPLWTCPHCRTTVSELELLPVKPVWE